MKILYVAMKYDYMDPSRGYSFEHYNFYDSLTQMDGASHEIIYFPFDEIMENHGRAEMNRMLMETAERIAPDLCFFFLFTDEIDFKTIKYLTDKGIKTFNWFADDHWRFDNFSKYWCKCFNYISTTDSLAPEKYQNIGYNNVIKTQWACNHFLYKPKNQNIVGKYKYDASFVGQPHGKRRKIIKQIARRGVKVECFGAGWPSGKSSQERMIEIFNESRINLNLAKSSGGEYFKNILRIFFSKKNGRLRLNSLRSMADNYKSMQGRSREQIKGRNFEVPGCGGFLITEDADNLREYYRPDEEIVICENSEDLIEKIRYYLKNEEKREEIAIAGYKRTLKEHTYEQRFRDIFKIIFPKYGA